MRSSRSMRPARALAALGLALPLAGAGAPGHAVLYPIQAMGTYVHVTLVTADSAASAPDAQGAHRAIRLVGSLMGDWAPTSEGARINRAPDSIARPGPPPGRDRIA